MNRRHLLTAAAAGAMLPGAVKADVAGQIAPPDAALIAACTEFLRIQRAFEAYYDMLPGDMAKDDPHAAMLEPLDGLADRIVALRATTAEGHLARARCAAFHYLSHHRLTQDDPDGAFETRFEAAGLRDLVHWERGDTA